MPRSHRALTLRTAALSLLLALGLPAISHAVSPVPPPAADADLAPAHAKKQTAIFSGGCFWGTQAVFERVKGVLDTEVGYAGGDYDTATYEKVLQENTGHAESVKIVYDPAKITYGQLLRIFFAVAHDPTTLNRQGPDIGPSYRSVIWFKDDNQRRIAQAYIAQLDAAHIFPGPIVTKVEAYRGFYDAELYHQDYALHHPENPTVQSCDRPKIEALKEEFPELFVEYHSK